jgi:hypothetical protein
VRACVCILSYPVSTAHATYYTVICGLPAWLAVPYVSILSQTARFSEQVSANEMCFDFLSNFCVIHFSLYEEFSGIVSSVYTGFHVKYPLILPKLNKTWIFSKELRKSSNIRLHENPSSGSWVVPFGRRRFAKSVIKVRIENWEKFCHSCWIALYILYSAIGLSASPKLW